MSVFIGIDPGVKGAIAVIDGDTVTLHDMPTYEKARGSDYATGEMAELLEPYQGRAQAALEQASAPRPAPGEERVVSTQRSSMKIGRGQALWEGVMAAYRIAYETPRPQDWKRQIGLPTGADKKASRALAQQLFPHLRAELGKRRADFSEALLLALWMKRRAAAPPARGTGRRKGEG